VRLAPERALTHEILGEVLLELRRLPEAEACFRRALALDPESFEAMNNLGVALQRQGRDQEAMDLFLQAARLDPTSTLAQENLTNAIDRHVDPRPEMSRPVQIGLILLAVVLPPVRLLMLLWWVTSLVVRRSRIRGLPATLAMAYRLRRRSSFSWTAALFWLGVVAALLCLMAAVLSLADGSNSEAFKALLVMAAFVALAAVTGLRLWRQRRVGTHP
jgi:tetratricopeptide (TPR) repeat protein